MKTAIVKSSEVTAGPDAPRRATCPGCNSIVLLSRTPNGDWLYRHRAENIERSGCPHRYNRNTQEGRWSKPPHLAVTLAAIRQAILDSLDGSGIEILSWLFNEEPQIALQDLLGLDAESTREATKKVVHRIAEISQANEGYAVHKLIGWRKDYAQVWKIFNDDEYSVGD